MTLGNFRRALQYFVRRRPFRSYLIELVSGETIQVTHPEAVYLSDEVIVHISPGRQNRLLDCSSVCELLDLPSHKSS